MRIITWNCNGALRNKLDEVNSLNADILVIQECENPEYSTSKYKEWAGDNYLWVGENKNKGIGIFSKNDFSIQSLEWNGEFILNGLRSKSKLTSWITSDLKLFLPFSVNQQYNILAVWTKGKQGERFDYIGQLWKYLQIHHTELSEDNTIILGDFNSNQKWDRDKRVDTWWNHASVVEELSELGFESLYHIEKNELQGIESMGTYFHHKKENQAHHIDYIFVSHNLLSQSMFEIGGYKDWIKVSDHVPLILNQKEKIKCST